jgi:hypothetical protein
MGLASKSTKAAKFAKILAVPRLSSYQVVRLSSYQVNLRLLLQEAALNNPMPGQPDDLIT